jgi:GH25 family lysozyme M1 (1,4-beta-N-acetylmuramidase)
LKAWRLFIGFVSLVLTIGLISAPATAQEAVEVVPLVESQPGLVVLTAPSEVPLGARFRITGAIEQSRQGVQIDRQMRQGKKWVTVASVKTRADGTWTMRVTAPNKGQTLRYRIIASGLKAKPQSNPFRVVVKKPTINYALESPTVRSGEPINIAGAIAPAANNVTLQLQTFNKKNKNWRRAATTKTAQDGSFAFSVAAPAKSDTYRYRIVSTKGISSTIQTGRFDVQVAPLIESFGPGARILGADISRWQHPGNAPINFTQMYNSGVRFIFVKASDGLPVSMRDAHPVAVRWSNEDVPAARAAGLLVGIYHFAWVPNITGADLDAEAIRQAELAIERLNALGGYRPGMMPLVLDIEASGVSRKVKPAQVLQYSRVWLNHVEARTGRTPIIYSNTAYLRSHLSDPSLARYPLWVANVADTANPGATRARGCIPTVWTRGGCDLDWQFWQYTWTAPGRQFGIARGNLDLNVFRGDANQLLRLAGF